MAKYTDNTNGGVEVDRDPADPTTKWLLEQGYLGKVKTSDKDGNRGLVATSTPAKDDPTLAANREKPTPVDKIKPHLANGDDTGDTGETVHGKHMGLDAEVTSTAPTVKVKPNAAAGKDAGVSDDTGASLKPEIDKGTEKVTTGTPA
jgi:hypothetical protein